MVSKIYSIDDVLVCVFESDHQSIKIIVVDDQNDNQIVIIVLFYRILISTIGQPTCLVFLIS